MRPSTVLDVAVPASDRGYPVEVGADVVSRLGAHLQRAVPRARRVALVSDTNVMPLYGDAVVATIEAAGPSVVRFEVTPGEASKNPNALLDLVGALVDAGLGRRDAVVALGGGVVGDLAGLVAALFMRGIAFVQCPTSLLAQVDASVGGKVAVDLAGGKNLLGAFHFPAAVLIDPTVLQTLPDDELGCGLAEMLKHGALFSRAHVDELLAGADRFYARDPDALGSAVAASVALKAACVAADPLEEGGEGRVLLNFGHTVGHAIEHASRFAIKHGQAVGLGMRAAARISTRRGLAGGDLEQVFTDALARLRLPTDLDRWLRDDVIDEVVGAMGRDKKRAGETVTYIGLASLQAPHVFSLTPTEIRGLLRG